MHLTQAKQKAQTSVKDEQFNQVGEILKKLTTDSQDLTSQEHVELSNPKENKESVNHQINFNE